MVLRVQQAASPSVAINYQSIGSGGGIRQLTNQTVFFGATDGPMTDEQMQAAPGKILHLPTVLGAVVPIYNVPGRQRRAEVHRPAARRHLPRQDHQVERPGDRQAQPRRARCPTTDITVVHRSDGSGTTYIWVDYLAKVSPEWKKKVGVDTSVNWPVGLGGKGNEGVTGLVKQTPGSIGYVELIYALQNKIAYGSVQNAAGEFVKASIPSVTAAAAAAVAADAGRLPRVDHQRAGQGRLSDLVVHLAAALREPEGQGAEPR